MSEYVQFEEDIIPPSRYDADTLSGRSFLVRFLVKAGLVGNERQALFLTSIIVLALLIFATFYVSQALSEPQIIELRVK